MDLKYQSDIIYPHNNRGKNMNKKSLRNILVSFGLVLSLIACSDTAESEEKVVKVEAKNLSKIVLNVEGMTCEGCESAIQTNLSKLDGVTSVKASHVAKTTEIEFDTTKIDTAKLETAIVETGYKIVTAKEAKLPSKEVSSSEMKCGAGKCGGK